MQPADMFRNVVLTLGATSAEMDVQAIRQATCRTIDEVQTLPVVLNKLATDGLLRQSESRPDRKSLSVAGERLADNLRGLSASDTAALERKAALEILKGVAAGRHPDAMRTAHVGYRRHLGISSSLVTHGYMETLHLGRAHRLTERGKTVLKLEA
mgnify:CR=1 FL=1